MTTKYGYIVKSLTRVRLEIELSSVPPRRAA